MNTENSTAKPNLIVEAAGNLVETVVAAIAVDASDPNYNAAWAARYPSLVDLNVVTAKSAARREDTIEKIDRWPWCGFIIDEVIPSPEESADQHFLGNFLCIIGVESEVFSMALQEIYEIHHHVRSLLLLDKSLGSIGGIAGTWTAGGVIDHIRWKRFVIPEYDELAMRIPTLIIQSVYEIAFKEVTYR